MSGLVRDKDIRDGRGGGGGVTDRHTKMKATGGYTNTETQRQTGELRDMNDRSKENGCRAVGETDG